MYDPKQEKWLNVAFTITGYLLVLGFLIGLTYGSMICALRWFK